MFAASFLLILILLLVFVCLPVWIREIIDYRRGRREGVNPELADPLV